MNFSPLQFAISLAREAGAIMKAHYSPDIEIIYKSDNSRVTAADLEINALIIARVKAAYPDHSILAEEGSCPVDGSTYTWVGDPIDGTLLYSAGLPVSMFMLALVENGIPILGVLFDPFQDRMYTAEKGKGAFLNGQSIHVSDRDAFPKATISNESGAFHALTPLLCERGTRVTRFYCMSAACALVAIGQFDAVIFGSTTAWDVAAIKVLVEEAGGKVTDIHGNEQRYDQDVTGAIISNGHLHGLLRKEISALLREKQLPTRYSGLYLPESI